MKCRSADLLRLKPSRFQVNNVKTELPEDAEDELLSVVDSENREEETASTSLVDLSADWSLKVLSQVMEETPP